MYPFSSSLHIQHICPSFVLCFAIEQNFLLIHLDKKRERIATLGRRGYFVVVWLRHNESKGI